MARTAWPRCQSAARQRLLAPDTRRRVAQIESTAAPIADLLDNCPFVRVSSSPQCTTVCDGLTPPSNTRGTGYWRESSRVFTHVAPCPESRILWYPSEDSRTGVRRATVGDDVGRLCVRVGRGLARTRRIDNGGGHGAARSAERLRVSVAVGPHVQILAPMTHWFVYFALRRSRLGPFKTDRLEVPPDSGEKSLFVIWPPVAPPPTTPSPNSRTPVSLPTPASGLPSATPQARLLRSGLEWPG